jgi:hypothetical protein
VVPEAADRAVSRARRACAVALSFKRSKRARNLNGLRGIDMTAEINLETINRQIAALRDEMLSRFAQMRLPSCAAPSRSLMRLAIDLRR